MNSSRWRVAAVVGLGLVLAAATPLSAQWEVQADVMSRYIWRGFDLYPNNHPAFQPSLTYSAGESGFSFNFWASFALAERSIYQEFDEIDITLDYAFSPAEGIDMSVGFIQYGYYFMKDFDFKDSTTQEIYISAGLPDVFLAPALTAYYDFNLGSGLYLLLEGSHSIALSESVGLDISAGLGYNSRQFIEESGFSDLTIGASLPVKLGGWTIAPRVCYTFVFLEAVNDENEFWFGISLYR
ncbi:MAG: hypothetical protein JW843_08915 [Candidatus Aminicenantes bacterium]|nr:hypothetical protein [Candidatus Aminicenantes bacterium]